MEGLEAALVPHPAQGGSTVGAIRVHVVRRPGGTLTLTYTLEGDIGRLRIPGPQPPRFADELWRHTCCELFVSCEGQPGYHEFNFSPSGEWAAYAFARYRERVVLAADGLAPQIELRRTATALELKASVNLDQVSAVHTSANAGAKMALALSVVAEEQDGALAYWALRHAPGRPDFHHADGFALMIE